MGSDGAHMGIDARRAIGVILGGQDQPKAEERQTRKQVRARVMATASPLEGSEPAEYGDAADRIAKAFLLFLDEVPDQRAAALDTDLYEVIEARWLGFDYWLGGATGFMVGWATNCVRWLEEQEPVPNSAIVEI